jgi:cell wall-associated NlpC family hydrolase
MIRTAIANLTLRPGAGLPTEHRLVHVENWQTEQSMDNDADTFSLSLGDSDGEVLAALGRDTEARVSLFITNEQKSTTQVFAGIAADVGLNAEFTQTLEGQDVPYSVLDTDSEPGRWRHQPLRTFLLQRGAKLGLTNISIPTLGEVGTIWTDGTEKEWSLWYRLVRNKGLYMWSSNTGRLIIDYLNYAPSSFTYSFGTPLAGTRDSDWIKVIDVQRTSSKNTRVGKVLVYGANPKQKLTRIGKAIDPFTENWARRPTLVIASTTAHTQAAVQKEAANELFESMVGTQEYVLTIRDSDTLIEQNKTARINLPDYGLAGIYYVVGIARSATDEGFVQQVRLRDRGFALSERIPTAPQAKAQQGENDSTANLGTALRNQGIRWADAFVRAAREFGQQNGWDLSLYLGVLLSICANESNFLNVREGSHTTEEEWTPRPTTAADPNLSPKNPVTGEPEFPAPTLTERVRNWMHAFANEPGSPGNPNGSAAAGVGPMQLTTQGYKDWADEYGFGNGYTGVAKKGEYDGGRWNPPSNIRAAARALYTKIQAVGADPNNPDTIWAAVRAYNGIGQAAENYMQRVKATYHSKYEQKASAVVTSSPDTVRGSAQRVFNFPNGDTIRLPDSAPNEVAKAITNALALLGQPYVPGGDGVKGYDCSSFVTYAMASASPRLKGLLNEPRPGNHGETTYTLWDKGTSVAKDDLLPGDLVFFHSPAYGQHGHVGMFLGQGLFVHDPHSGDVVKIAGLGQDYYRENYEGGKRFFTWATRPN